MIWKFDRPDFKEAITLLLLNDIKEQDENDLELKKLIRLQFKNDLDMLKWATDLFEKVCKLCIIIQYINHVLVRVFMRYL